MTLILGSYLASQATVHLSLVANDKNPISLASAKKEDWLFQIIKKSMGNSCTYPGAQTLPGLRLSIPQHGFPLCSLHYQAGPKVGGKDGCLKLKP